MATTNANALPPVPPEAGLAALEAEVRALLAENKKIEAIRQARLRTTWDLARAKEYVEQLERSTAPNVAPSTPVPAELDAEVRQAVAENNRTKAIILLKHHLDWDHDKAKGYVDWLDEQAIISAQAEKDATALEQTVIEVEAENWQAAREKALAQTPLDLGLVSLERLSDDKPVTVQAVAATTEEAFAQAQRDMPASASLVEKKVVAAPGPRTVVIEAMDEPSARAQAASQFGNTATVSAVRLKAAGKPGFMGVGKKPNQYEAEVIHLAVVEITYKPLVRLSAKVGPALRGSLSSLRTEDDVKRALQKLGLTQQQAELNFSVAVSTVATRSFADLQTLRDMDEFWHPVTSMNLALRWAAKRYIAEVLQKKGLGSS